MFHDLTLRTAHLVEWQTMRPGLLLMKTPPASRSRTLVRSTFGRWWHQLDVATRIVDPATDAAFAKRWDELPDRAKTDAQILGQASIGCEGTHGVFPKCDFACKPCYHSADANKVRIDGPHTLREVRAQMAFLRSARGPATYAQLIGGEVTLLAPDDHAAALHAMRAEGRIPMSFSHGDFDDDYLHRVVLGPDGTPRHRSISWAVHIDSTMKGRTGVPKPASERDLDGVRHEAIARFERLKADHGIRSYVAHNMTVTPSNLGEVAETIRRCGRLGFKMFSFQPAAYVGNESRWEDGFREVTDDAVWDAISAGAGRPLPYRVLQFGDLRCNRIAWGAFVGDTYVPILTDDDPLDAEARDIFFTTFRGNRMNVPSWLRAVKFVRAIVSNPRVVPAAVSWARRFVRRAGGLRSLRRGIVPVTFVMHSFIDTRDVAPAWDLLKQGEVSEEPQIRAAQERLQACTYTMGHPETGELVPACVQHSVLDPHENRQLVELLPMRPR
jgi:MoaA/NifB/PqqE/SkfB family radical SAM enzyme